LAGFRGDQALGRLLEYPDIVTVLDVGSGCGYHAGVMRQAGRVVTTVSMQEPADHVGDFMGWDNPLLFDAIWACHVLEHQVDPGAFLRKCLAQLRHGGYLFVTVPPLKHQVVGGHVTLWNAGLLCYQLILAGFDCSEARAASYGYNISVIVRKSKIDLPALTHDGGDINRLANYFPLPLAEGFDGRLPNIRWGGPAPPRHVSIIGLGPSAEKYVDRVKRMGSRRAFCDETWAINAMGSALDCDIVFHMDDIRIQELRAAAKPESNIARMVDWLRTYKGRVITSRAYSDYPCLEEFPLEAVINHLGRAYFNNTAAYALAYALYLGVEKVSIFGCDYTYPNAHDAEKGRACLEFWLGYAASIGVEIWLPGNTSLMDQLEDEGREDATLYGYDTVRLLIDQDAAGMWRVEMDEIAAADLPTAEEIERQYDHSRPPVEQRKAS